MVYFLKTSKYASIELVRSYIVVLGGKHDSRVSFSIFGSFHKIGNFEEDHNSKMVFFETLKSFIINHGTDEEGVL